MTNKSIINLERLAEYHSYSKELFAQYDLRYLNPNTSNTLAYVDFYKKNHETGDKFDSITVYTKYMIDSMLGGYAEMEVSNDTVTLKSNSDQVTVPTTSFIQSYVSTALENAIGANVVGGIRYKGSVNLYSDLLQKSDAVAGDMWNVKQDEEINNVLYPGDMNYIAYVESGQGFADDVDANTVGKVALSYDAAIRGDVFRAAICTTSVSVPAGGSISVDVTSAYDDETPGVDLVTLVDTVVILGPYLVQGHDGEGVYVIVDTQGGSVSYWHNSSNTTKNVLIGAKVPTGHYGMNAQFRYVVSSQPQIKWDPQAPTFSVNVASTTDITNLFS